uniref:Uncharacterized protein n=1 Tax=Pipistrellus kuhlii TaxID=59472 RepID=A0A7J7WDV2_PIPKU|nr:hypothetical protein mPipKuh1_008081 [Pipistrellus kuhlii]
MAWAAEESRISSFQSSPLLPEGMARCCCLPSQMPGWLGILVSSHLLPGADSSPCGKGPRANNSRVAELMENGYHQGQPSVTALQTGKQPQEVGSLCIKSTETSLWSEKVTWEDLLHRSTCSRSRCY